MHSQEQFEEAQAMLKEGEMQVIRAAARVGRAVRAGAFAAALTYAASMSSAMAAAAEHPLADVVAGRSGVVADWFVRIDDVKAALCAGDEARSIAATGALLDFIVPAHEEITRAIRADDPSEDDEGPGTGQPGGGTPEVLSRLVHAARASLRV